LPVVNDLPLVSNHEKKGREVFEIPLYSYVKEREQGLLKQVKVYIMPDAQVSYSSP
jgi:hypothetical protein